MRSHNSFSTKIGKFVLVPIFIYYIFQIICFHASTTPFDSTEEEIVGVYNLDTVVISSNIGVNANAMSNLSDVVQKSSNNEYDLESNTSNNSNNKGDNALISTVSSNPTTTRTTHTRSNTSKQTTTSNVTYNTNNEPDQVHVHVQSKRYNETEYEVQLEQSIKPLHNVSTCTYVNSFYGGFCNQYQMFTGVIVEADELNHSQILLHPLKWKDTLGTNKRIPHRFLFDVVHWNTYYPRLPRMVTYEKSLHYELELTSGLNDIRPNFNWNITDPYVNATKPYGIGNEKPKSAWIIFKRYSKAIEEGGKNRSDAELLMLREAFKPHPIIQQIIDDFKSVHQMKNILVWHARIEPDMQKHDRVCTDYKVTNISDIVDMIYEKYEEPPVSTVLIALDRSLLEKEVSDPSKTNELALHNLHVLNEIMSKGMWGGRVKVLEAGSQLAKHSGSKFLTKVSTLVGSIINFFLFLEADIFIGTKVSSWSHYVMMYRFFREKKMNYFYQPKGLDWVTPPLVDHPPRFIC
mmetsp:Transcript_28396/g.33058  ORF Transcript_28396/g.33058 Transcript_28396/m.33058 type:complete len:518 (+) Transcript_28396:82-1635(+)